MSYVVFGGASGLGQPEACPPGTVSTVNGCMAAPCPPPYFLDNDGECVVCPPGTSFDKSINDCATDPTACPSSMIFSEVDGVCLCPSGFIQGPGYTCVPMPAAPPQPGPVATSPSKPSGGGTVGGGGQAPPAPRPPETGGTMTAAPIPPSTTVPTTSGALPSWAPWALGLGALALVFVVATRED